MGKGKKRVMQLIWIEYDSVGKGLDDDGKGKGR